MIFIDNQTESLINIDILENISNYLNIDRDIELIIVDNIKIKDINKEQRGINRPTDVLSFPIVGDKPLPLGSIVISIDKVKDASSTLGHSIDYEIALLFTHGLLHLLGFDHEEDDGEMREKEREIMLKFNLPKTLIVRVEEGKSC